MAYASGVFRAIATEPTELNSGYDHYALCRKTARMAAENLERALGEMQRQPEN
jgi:hypothetical protein